MVDFIALRYLVLYLFWLPFYSGNRSFAIMSTTGVLRSSPAKSGDSQAKSAAVPPGPASSNASHALLRWTGFTKTSNLVLFILTAGVFAIFCASQFEFMRNGQWMKPIAPGEIFWFREGLMYWGFQIHLWSVVRKS
jgi:hypothetical protein